ncbi:hypothetical protein OAU44_00345 [bacterium]|nr:hypothetical protein [bacterium]
MAWAKAGSVTLEANDDVISLTGFTPSKFSTYLLHAVEGSGTLEPRFRLNNDTSGHSNRMARDGDADTTAPSRGDWVTSITDASDDNFNVGYLCNIDGKEKLGITRCTVNNGTGYTTNPRRREVYSKYTDSGSNAQITRFDNIDTDTSALKGIGSNLTLLGSGMTPSVGKPTNVQDNSILVEKNTARRYWFDEAVTPILEPDFLSSTGWLQQGTEIAINTGTEKLDWIGLRSSTNTGISYDFGAGIISTSKWRLEFDLYIQNFSGSSYTQRFGWMLSTKGSADNSDQLRDFIGGRVTYRGQAPTNYQQFNTIDDQGSTVTWADNVPYQPAQGTDNGVTPVAGTTYNIVLTRDSATAYTMTISSGGTLLDTLNYTSYAGTSDLRYLLIQRYGDSANAGSSFNGTIDNLKFYNGVTSATPATWTMNPTFEDDFNTDDWDNMSSRINVNTTTEKLDFAMYRDGANDSAVYDLGAGNVSDTKWLLRWKMNFTAVYASGNGNRLWFGLSSLPQTTNQNTAQDSIMMYQNHDFNDKFSASYSNGAALPQTNTETPDYATGTDYYCELKRTSSTTIESRMWTGGYDGTLLTNAEDSVSNSTIGSVTGLRYVKMSNIFASQGGSVITGTIDDLKFYNGVTTPN